MFIYSRTGGDYRHLIAQETIDALNAIPMPDIFNRYGIDWCEGRNFKRPWGNTATGRTPSCRYYPHTNSVADFGTHTGGGPIRFVMLMDNLSFPAACKKLAGWFGVQGSFDFDPEAYSKMRMSKAEERADKERQYETESRFAFIGEAIAYDKDRQSSIGVFMLAAAFLDTDTFEDFVFSENCKINYLFEISEESKETIKSYIERMQSGGIDTYSQSRGHNPPCSCFKNPFVILPILYPCGNTVIPLGFNDRDITPNAQIKYNFDSVFSKRDLVYGIDRNFIESTEHFPVILTEGIYDSLRLKSLGFPTAVTPLTARLTKMQAAYLCPLAKHGFILAFDGDAGGESAKAGTEKVLKYRKQKFTNISVAAGEDPDTEGMKNPEGLISKITMAANMLAQI